MRNNKLRLFEVMARMDKTFKPNMNEEFYGNDRTSCFDDKIRMGTDYEVKENYDAEIDSVIPDNSSLDAQIKVDNPTTDGSDGNVSSIVPDNSSVGAKTTGLDTDIEPIDNNDPHVDTDTTNLDENYPAGADLDPRAPWNQPDYDEDEEPYEYEPEYEHDDDIDEAIDNYCSNMNEEPEIDNVVDVPTDKYKSVGLAHFGKNLQNFNESKERFLKNLKRVL